MADSWDVERFRFSLERVLALRARREKLARQAMAAALAELQQLEAKAERLRADQRTCRDEGAATSPSAGLAQAVERGLTARIVRIGREIESAERALATARDAYRQRRVELRSMERLRETRHAAWSVRVAKAEQAELDELARLRRAVRSIGDSNIEVGDR